MAFGHGLTIASVVNEAADIATSQSEPRTDEPMSSRAAPKPKATKVVTGAGSARPDGPDEHGCLGKQVGVCEPSSAGSEKRDGQQVIETIPDELVARSWKNHVLTVGVMMTVACLAISIGAVYRLGGVASVLVSAFLWPSAALLILGKASACHTILRMNVPTVELRSDRLTVRFGKRTRSAKVGECRLFRGPATRMRLTGGVRLYCPTSVILIDLPPFTTYLGLRRSGVDTVAVGYSDEMRQQWEEALIAAQDWIPDPLSGKDDKPQSFEQTNETG